MIAPARRAAVDALAVIDAGDLDMGSAIARARAGLHDERDRALLLEIVTGTLRMQAAIDYQLAARVKRPLARLDTAVLRVLQNERVPADLPVAAARFGDHQRCRRADAAIRKIERGRTHECGAAIGVAGSRRAVVAVARERRRAFLDRSSRTRAGSSIDGCSATANRRPSRGSHSTTNRRPCAWPSIVT